MSRAFPPVSLIGVPTDVGAGHRGARSLVLVDFLAEEVSIFGVSCIGSRGMIGERPDEWPMRDDLVELAGRYGLGSDW